MALPFQMRSALFVLFLHGMGLCVAADNEASAGATALLKALRRLSLDDVTGRLTLYGNVVAREPAQAIFRNGVGVTLDHDEQGAGTR